MCDRRQSKGRGMLRVSFLLTCLMLPAVALANEPLPRPAALEPQIRFWRAIFGVYSEHQVVLHDTWDLDKVYDVLDFRPYLEQGWSRGEVEQIQKVETADAVERLRATLLRLDEVAADPRGLSPEEQRLYDLFRGDPDPGRFRAATDRLRTQRGLRERFAEGLRRARAFFPEMERIFQERGIPTEITRLPLIESCFNLDAYSKVGAAGVWQFMPATGRRFLTVGDSVDERRDPIASTHAAAAYLREMYDQLDSWPLAITGYNQGPEAMARAERELGTSDIATVVREYRGRSFGFAGRNFYAEFIAALDIDRHAHAYFGSPPPWPRPATRAVELDMPIGIEHAARLADTDRESLAELNPALQDAVIEGARPIPTGYALRIPQGAGAFETRLAVLADEMAERQAREREERQLLARSRNSQSRAAVARAGSREHRVSRGQTLEHIAKRYRVSVASLRSANGLGRRGVVRAGQVLRIPRTT